LFRHPEVRAKRASKDERALCSNLLFFYSKPNERICLHARCDGSYYVGSATGRDLTKRIAEHQSGAFPGYPFSRRPVELVWSEHFERIIDAIAVERKLKG
jgi:predicted GIY-YIG superfamily endonuclease